MTSPPTHAAPQTALTLAPRLWVPLGTIGLGLSVLILLPWWSLALWPAIVVVLLGAFLLLQTALLRLQFSDEALLVLRLGTEIRRFPYSEWIGWRVFWPRLPVLFYFREQRSLHLLPMLFDADSLRRELEQRLSPTEPSPSP